MAKISAARRKALQKEKAKNQRGNFYSMKNLKKAVFRLLPLKEDEEVGFKVGQHFFGRGRPFVCPDVTYGRACPVCEIRSQLLDIDDEEAEQLADRLRPRIRYAMKIIDRDDDENVQVAEMPKTVYDVIFEVFDSDGEDISAAQDGRDFRVSKKGSGFDTEYSTRLLDESPLAASTKTVKTLVAAANAIDFPTLYPVDMEGLKDHAESAVPSSLLESLNITPAEDDEDDFEDDDEDFEDEDADEEDDGDEEEDDGDEEEDEDFEDDEDEDDEDEDEDAEDDLDDADLEDDEDDLDDDEDDLVDDEDDEDEEEPAPPPRGRKKSSSKKTSKKATSRGSKKTSKKATSRGSKKTTKKTSSKGSKNVKEKINKSVGRRRRVVRRGKK